MRRGSGDLWAITSYFNPMSYKTRRANYRLFRERLSVPIVAVELAYDSDFELTDGDADILIQLRGGDILWQKERLFNIAIDALPDVCSKVAVLDCDICFGRGDWAEQTSRLLDGVGIAQLYSAIHYLSPGATPESAAISEPPRVSLVSAVASGADAEACLEGGNGAGVGLYGTGLAWGVRRELLDRHSMYDAFILGGGDRAMIAAVFGCFEHVVRRQRLNDLQREHFQTWAEPFQRSVARSIGFIDGDIFHLWHGTLADRRWRARYDQMPKFRFSPSKDITLAKHGAWQWSSDKPELHAYVREHFVLRREDGNPA